MTTLGVLALLLFAQIPQGRVCGTPWLTAGNEERYCSQWMLLDDAKRDCEALNFNYKNAPRFEVEMRSQKSPNMPIYRPGVKECE